MSSDDQIRRGLLNLSSPDVAARGYERVRAAIKNSGCFFLMKRITVNLAPADLKKEGPHLPLTTPSSLTVRRDIDLS